MIVERMGERNDSEVIRRQQQLVFNRAKRVVASGVLAVDIIFNINPFTAHKIQIYRIGLCRKLNNQRKRTNERTSDCSRSTISKLTLLITPSVDVISSFFLSAQKVYSLFRIISTYSKTSVDRTFHRSEQPNKQPCSTRQPSVPCSSRLKSHQQLNIAYRQT